MAWTDRFRPSNLAKWLRKRQGARDRRLEETARRKLRAAGRKAELEADRPSGQDVPDIVPGKSGESPALPTFSEGERGGQRAQDFADPSGAWQEGDTPDAPTIDARRDDDPASAAPPSTPPPSDVPAPESPIVPLLPGDDSAGFDIPRGPAATEDPFAGGDPGGKSPADAFQTLPDDPDAKLPSPQTLPDDPGGGPLPFQTLPLDTPSPGAEESSPTPPLLDQRTPGGIPYTELPPGGDIPDTDEVQPPVDDSRAPEPPGESPFTSQDLDGADLDVEGATGAGGAGAGGISPPDVPLEWPGAAEVPPPSIALFGGVNPDPGMSPGSMDQFQSLREAVGLAQGDEQDGKDNQQVLEAIESLREILEDHGNILARLEEQMKELMDRPQGGVGP